MKPSIKCPIFAIFAFWLLMWARGAIPIERGEQLAAAFFISMACGVVGFALGKLMEIE